MIVTDWLGKMINLPRQFLHCNEGDGGGVCQTSSSESSLIGLLAAKAKKFNELKNQKPDWSIEYILPRLVAYTSEQAHCSALRSGLLAGIKMKSLRGNKKNILTCEIVKKEVEQDLNNGLIPFYVSNNHSNNFYDILFIDTSIILKDNSYTWNNKLLHF